MDKRVVNAIAIVVTCVWAVSFLADIAMKTYEPSPYIHVIMMAVAGAAFGGGLIRKNGHDEHDKEEPPIDKRRKK